MQSLNHETVSGEAGMRYFSTFSGIGGFELGIQQAYETLCNAHGSEVGGGKADKERNKRQRFQPSARKDVGSTKRPVSERDNNISNKRPLCVGYSEIDKYAVQIYQHHFPEHKNYGDITKINAAELPDFDLLVGGFPCQSFSIAGKRKGFEDTRGTMFFEIARIIREKRPRFLLLENVKGLLSHDQGATFFTIITTLDELGYDLQWQVLNSKNFGVPQNRERVFIVGHLRGTSRPQVFPLNGTSKNDINTRGLYEGNKGRVSQSEEGQEKIEYTRDTYNEKIGESPLHERSSQTSIRRLTPKECERLQGFPDGWTDGVSDTQRYKTLGNAVTVNVIRDIMMKIL